jgi:Mrp family chromosome partitioning ATPase
VQTDPVGNVAVIGIAGAFGDAERLNGKGKFESLIAELREHYDLILLDLPPVLPIAEARELTALADNVVFVAKWRQSHDEAVRAGLKLLPMGSISHIGVALNAVDMRKRMQVDGAEAFYRQYHKYYEGRARGV